MQNYSNKRKPRSPGVMLQGRLPLRGNYYAAEIHADGGKAKLHRQVRQAEKRAVHKMIMEEM